MEQAHPDVPDHRLIDRRAIEEQIRFCFFDLQIAKPHDRKFSNARIDAAADAELFAAAAFDGLDQLVLLHKSLANAQAAVATAVHFELALQIRLAWNFDDRFDNWNLFAKSEWNDFAFARVFEGSRF